MKLRLGTFNVENLFSRARAMMDDSPTATRAVLEDVARLDELLAKAEYAAPDKAEIKALLEKHDVENENARPFFVLQARGKLYSGSLSRTTHRTVVSRIVAKGRADWAGWIEWMRAVVPSEAVLNTARVIAAVDADILCLVEVENRTVLADFTAQILHAQGFLKGAHRYRHNLLIDGNDRRGIDVAILSRFPIRSVRSHIDDGAPNRIFSRDCPEYEVELPGGQRLWMLCNHFKSKGYGLPAATAAKRRKQAEAVSRIATTHFDLARDLVVIVGDLNDTPDSPALAPLLQTPGLHSAFDALPAGADSWTYGGSHDQIDHLLVSTPLGEKLALAAIERRGLWSRDAFAGKYPHFPEVTEARFAASDHAAVWAEFSVA